MSSTSSSTRAVAIPPDEIASALRSAAVPGYTGSLHIELRLLPEAANNVMLEITRRQSQKSADTSTRESVPAIGEHVRKKSVQNVMTKLNAKLLIRTVVLAIEAHYVDGDLKSYTVEE